MKLLDYSAPQNLLTNHIIMVTGAAHGIGRAASKSFSAYGATVILLDKDVPALESLYDEIINTGLPEPAIYPMDLSGATAEEYETMQETLGRNFNQLDGLLHNAAQLGTLTPISSYDPKQWDKVMTVNVKAPLMITRACTPLLKAADAASLLFTSDQTGREGKAYWGAYGVSKFATEGLMQILAEELEANTSIRVNSIDPGPVRTMLRSAAYPGETPEKSCLPEEIMAGYLYMMGKDSHHLNGQALTIQT